MKQFKLTFLLTVLMSMVGAKANAHDFDVDGIYYNITSAKDYTVAVSYKGSDFKSYEEILVLSLFLNPSSIMAPHML